MRCAWILAGLMIAGCTVTRPQPITVAEFLAQQTGIPLAEAERRIGHQNAIEPLIVAASADPAWGGLRFEHTPEYRVYLGFSDGRARPELLALVPADLRPHIRFDRAPRSMRDANQMLSRLHGALEVAEVQADTAYDHRTGRFEVMAATESDRRRALAAVPADLKPSTDVTVGRQIVVN